MAYRTMRSQSLEWGMTASSNNNNNNNNSPSSCGNDAPSHPSKKQSPTPQSAKQNVGKSSPLLLHVEPQQAPPNSNVNKTKKLYVDGSTIAGNIKVVKATDTTLVLDGTVFHPQGGGQPCDVGSMVSSDGLIEFTVSMVKEDRTTGLIEHSGSFTVGSVNDIDLSKTLMNLIVDPARRVENTRNHSAGHLLDVVMTNLGFKLTPSKGYHFPDG
jgi:alanyl-tRNA synthetase